MKRAFGACATAVVTLGLFVHVVTENSAPAAADNEQYSVSTTTDIPVRMSDGRVLRARIDAPADPATGKPAAGKFPVILAETPYGKTLQPPIPAFFVQRGYLGVTVDVAGTGGSEGQSQLFGNQEAKDSVEVIDWAAALPNSTGKVGMFGGSYLGIDQLFAAAAVGPNSPLKAIFPIDASVDPYRDLFTSGGIVNAESGLGLIAAYFGVRTLTPPLERPTDIPDALRLAIEHAAAGIPFELTTGLDVLLEGSRRFDGDYWRERAPETVLANIVRNGVPTYLVGGQYDVFQRGEPQLYSQLQNVAAGRPQFAPMTADQPVDPRFQLLFGPWDHSTAGGSPEIYDAAMRWFDQWLKGRDTGILDTTAPMHVIEPGGATYDARSYPNEGATPERFYLDANKKLSATAPGALGGADPLLFTGLSQACTRSTQQWSAGLIPPSVCGAKEPAPLPAPAQLTYTTPPLTDDVRLAGPIGLTLRTNSTASETLYTATLVDVAPEGKAVALSSGAQLGSLRAVDESRSWKGNGDGYLLPYHPLTKASAKAVPLLKTTRYDIEIRPVFASIPAGHRLQLRIGTGDVPHLLPPPTSLLKLAGLSTVQHNAAALSFLELPVVRR